MARKLIVRRIKALELLIADTLESCEGCLDYATSRKVERYETRLAGLYAMLDLA